MIEEDRWITALKALADRSRLRIIRTLLDQALTVNDISERLGISQYNVSKHLRILREAGLVEATKMANRREYAIPSHLRGQSPGAVLDLGSLVFHFDKLPIAAPQAVPVPPVVVGV
ncbi:MAG TPA: metalloregulator ArsR/SmtB family transcription factor [Chthoniobacteraceae bacterium]|jgi:DNA-binding transcriptional ArsR family regulator|nr:metalloregulator ArsR/SmtB family transcription factor [Chthoniobacteraceae bacterium]